MLPILQGCTKSRISILLELSTYDVTFHSTVWKFSALISNFYVVLKAFQSKYLKRKGSNNDHTMVLSPNHAIDVTTSLMKGTKHASSRRCAQSHSRTIFCEKSLRPISDHSQELSPCYPFEKMESSNCQCWHYISPRVSILDVIADIVTVGAVTLKSETKCCCVQIAAHVALINFGVAGNALKEFMPNNVIPLPIGNMLPDGQRKLAGLIKSTYSSTIVRFV